MRLKDCGNQKKGILWCHAVVGNRLRNVISGVRFGSECLRNAMSRRDTKLLSRNSKESSATQRCFWIRIKPWSRFIFCGTALGWTSGLFTQRGISVARWFRKRAAKERSGRDGRNGSPQFRQDFNGCGKTRGFSVHSASWHWMGCVAQVTKNSARILPQKLKKSGDFWA